MSEQRVISPSEMGAQNRALLLRTLWEYGPLTRADLARFAGVPRATISGITRPLIEAGLLEERKPERRIARVGKPGTPLWFPKNAGLTAAIVLHPDGGVIGIVNARGNILARAEFDLGDGTSDEIASRAIDALRELCGDRQLIGIGIAIPGACDASTNTVLGSTQLPNLVGDGLATQLATAFDLPVQIENDADTLAFGERWLGQGKGVDRFASVQTGHGLGVGLVLDCQVYRGDGRGGELGHIPLRPNGEICPCGLRGCWETIATHQWLERRAAELGVLDPIWRDDLWTSTDPTVRSLAAEYASNVSEGLVSLVHLFGGIRIILHGPYIAGGTVAMAALGDALRARILPHLRDEVTLVASELGVDAALLGAAGAVMQARLHLSA